MPGKAKTRLIPLLGERGAADFQAALTADALEKIRPLENRITLALMATGRWSHLAAPAALTTFAVPLSHRQSGAEGGFVAYRQRGQDLGERLQHAFRKLLRKHFRAVVIGTDSPELSAHTLLYAFRELLRADAVLGPCPDGGYYLVGLRRRGSASPSPLSAPPETLFHGIHWGTRTAFRDTLRNFKRYGLSCSLLEPLEDIDRPEDLKRLRARMASNCSLRRRAPATWKFLRMLAKDT